MKKVSDVFKSIRFAKTEPRGKPHQSTDDEEHGAVGEKEFEQQLKHVKKRAMQEQYREEGRFKPTIPHMVKNKGVGPRPSVDSAKVKLGEDASEDPREYDYEGDMVKSDLRSIMANAQRIIDLVKDEQNLPEWCQNKVTLAEDYISTVANYMTAEMNEEVEYLEEKNAPTNPSLWARAKSLARQKFDVYPSAYANGWAAKWYKSKGGGWKSVSEAVEAPKKKEEPPFEPDKPKKTSAVAGKHGVGYSTARHLARTAMKKQMKEQSIANPTIKADVVKKRPHIEPAASPLKESRKADIVREIVKKKKDENGKAKDKFEANPTLTSEIVKEDK